MKAAPRKLKQLEPASTSAVNTRQPEGVEPEWCCEARLYLQSGKLRITSDGNISVKRNDARADESQWYAIDLANCFLPATTMLNRCRVVDEDELCIAIALSLDTYLCESVRSKAQHKTAIAKAMTIAKLWEYGRLNDIYSLADWTCEHFAELERLHGIGGWRHALRLEERLEDLMKSAPSPEYVDGNRQYGLTSIFRFALGTSTSGKELINLQSRVLEELGLASAKRRRARSATDTRPTVSMLLQTFNHINDLTRLPDQFAIRIIPFPEYWTSAKKMGRPNTRTKNLKIDQAVPLLTTAFSWVYEKSRLFLELFHHLGKSFTAIENSDVTEKKKVAARNNLMQSEYVMSALETLTATDKVIDKAGHPSFATWGSAYAAYNSVLERIIGSCFLIFAVMNARRRDEILHRKFGIHATSVRVVAAHEGIYECLFYVEKTYRKYIPFFVNEASFKAFDLLCELRAGFKKYLNLRTDERADEDTLFRYHEISKTAGFSTTQRWYDFKTSEGKVGRKYIDAVFHGSEPIRTTAHMFRRFYAVIFIYRYENGSLLALMQQLGHFTPETTRQYVSDAISTKNSDRISIDVLHSDRAVHESFTRALEKEIQQASSEKFVETIHAILDGRRYAGNFEPYILRLHNKLMARVEFAGLSTGKRAADIAGLLTARGHDLQVFRHGECMAGQSAQRRLAHCYSRAHGGPAKQDASPRKCHGCPYHNVPSGYVQSLEGLLVETEDAGANLPIDSLKFAAMKSEMASIKFVIQRHRDRLAR